MSDPAIDQPPLPTRGAVACATGGRRRTFHSPGLIVLLAAPVFLVVITSKIVEQRGPLYSGTNADPSYVYLVNSLALAEGETPGHVDHPGTPVQLVGAAWVRFVVCKSVADDRCARKVFEQSEEILALLIIGQASLLAGMLLLGGFLVARTPGGLAVGLLWQWAPLASPSFAFESTEFKPEPWLLLFAGLLSAGLARRLLGGGAARPGVDGALCGALFATKVTALPLALAAYCSPGMRGSRMKFLAGLGLATGLLLAPAAPALGELARFLHRSAFGAGTYGRGETPRTELATWLANTARLAREEPALTLVFAFAAVVGVYGLMSRRRGEKPLGAQFLVMLSAIAAAYYLLGGFQPRSRYLVPLVGVMGVTAVLTRQQLLVSDRRRVEKRIGLAVALALAATFGWRDWSTAFVRLDASRVAGELAEDRAAHLPRGATVFEYYGSSSKPYALWMGAAYFGGRFGSTLSEITPGFIAVIPRAGHASDYYGIVDRERWSDRMGPYFARGRVPVRPEIGAQLDRAFRALGFTLAADGDWLAPRDCEIECLYELERVAEPVAGAHS